MNSTTTLSILQYNVMKSRDIVMASLLRDPSIREYDILAIQEPWRNPFMSTTHNPIPEYFHLHFPKDTREEPARVCFFVNKRLDETRWRITEHTRDVCTLRITYSEEEMQQPKEVAIHNVYNPPRSTENRRSSLPALEQALRQHADIGQVILGDFNLHYEYWGGQLERQPDPESEDLINIIQEFCLTSTLPLGITTFDARNQTSCIDLCYATLDIVDRIIRSGTDNEMDHNSDHLPITTILDVRAPTRTPATTPNWKAVDEKKLRKIVNQNLPEIRRPRTKAALDRYTSDIAKAIKTAIQKSVPIRRHSPRARPGWTQQCKDIQAEARRLKRYNSQEHTNESWEQYRKARNRKGRIIQKALRQDHRQRVEEATKSPQGMWNLARWAMRRGEKAATTTPVLRNPSTNENFPDAEGKSQLLKETFFPTPPEADLQDIEGATYEDQIILPAITEEEVHRTILAVPPMKAPGPDGIINKILQLISPQITPHLTRVFNQSLQLGYCPLHFRESSTVVLRKPGKDDYTVPKAYRPIALLNTIGKIMDAVIAKRISYITEKHQLLPRTHIGGRKGRSTEHAIHMVIEKIYEAWNRAEGQVASLLLLDVSGAFDNVSHKRLLHNLRKRRIDEKIVTWIASFLGSRHTHIVVDGYKSRKYNIATGIPQGSPLSPILYLFYNADLIEICNAQQNTLATGYIDDVAILSWGDTTEITCNALSTTLNLASQWAARHASVFAPGKFQLTHHTRCRRRINISQPIRTADIEIAPKNTCKYLGIIMDTELNWKQHVQEIKTRAIKATGALASLAGSTWGASLKDMRRIYQAVIVPTITYGCLAWSNATGKGHGYTRRTIDTLNSLQVSAARIIAGAYRATSGPALDVELYLLPMAQQIWKCNAESVSRLLSTHDIPGLVSFRSLRRNKNRWRSEPYLSPLAFTYRRLFQRRGPSIERQEVILPFLVPPWWQRPKIFIEPGPEQATKRHDAEARSGQNNLYVYTDGSGINNEIGAAAVSPMIMNEKKAYMGDSNTSTVFTAELQGIRLALTMALEDWDKGNRRRKVVIYTDNQAAIRTTNNPSGVSGAYIAADIVRLVDQLQATKQIRVEIKWIPAHTGITGNEWADSAAKEAAGWRSNEPIYAGNRADQPRRLYPLKAALSTWIKREVQREWEYSWTAETRGRTSYRHTPKPTHKVLHLHEKLSKRQSSILIQMRTEKIGLKDFLYHRKVPEISDPRCPCGEGRQTVMHVLLRCRRFKDLRRQALPRIPGRTDLRAILSERKAATKAISFMEQTQILGQFRIVE